MKKELLTIAHAFINFIYPPRCLHCNALLADKAPILCQKCLLLLELIDPSERCSKCFSCLYDRVENACEECRNFSTPFFAIAAAFDYAGPASTLVRKLKYANQPYLAAGCSGFLAAQFLRLGWPFPDAIIPVPISFTRRLIRDYNQSLLLAQELSLILKAPVKDALKRSSGDYSQAGLSRKQRQQLDGRNFYVRSNQHLRGQTILLIDDVMTTGSTFQRCAEALMSESPGQIYGLSVCRAV